MKMLFKCPEVSIAVEGEEEVVKRMASMLEGVFMGIGKKYELTVEK